MKNVVSLGPLVVDFVVALEEMPVPGEMNYVTGERHGKIDKNVGGHAAIVSTDMVGLGWEPKDVGVVGAIGRDENGRFLKKALEDKGIVLELQEVDSPTSENLIIAIKGEDKRYDLDPGANLDLSQDFVLQAMENLNPDVMYCCPGYTGIDEELEAVLGRVKEEWGSFIFLDIVDPFEKSKEFVMPALQYVDAFKLNEEEAMVVTGRDTIVSALEKLNELGIDTVFVTKGPKGVEVANGDYLISQPPFKVDAVDQTGCGDAFSTGLIYQILKKDIRFSSMDREALSRVLAFGQATGAIASTEAGATTAVTMDNVMELFDSQSERVLKETEIADRL